MTRRRWPSDQASAIEERVCAGSTAAIAEIDAVAAGLIHATLVQMTSKAKKIESNFLSSRRFRGAAASQGMYVALWKMSVRYSGQKCSKYGIRCQIPRYK
eukprot:1195501-Pleurochrysis_carterae.AAC.1